MRPTVKLLIDTGQIYQRISELAYIISTTFRFENKPVLFLGVLDECFMFLSELVKRVVLPNVEVQFVKVQKTKTEPELLLPLPNVTDKIVVIVNGLTDTDTELSYLCNKLSELNPATIRVCSLLCRNELQTIPVHVHFCGFEVSAEHVVGFGLSSRGMYGNLNAIFQYIGD